MYCPKCASLTAEGQRYCRQCGTNLGLILDAMEGKAVSIDFESLKKDMWQLGNSLRASFEEARKEIKKTRYLKRHRGRQPDWTGENIQSQIENDSVNQASGSWPAYSADAPQAGPMETTGQSVPPIIQQIKISSRKMPTPRKFSLQHGTLSIFGGAASSAALYYLLNTAGQSGLLGNLEQLILQQAEMPLAGIAPVFQALWVLGLIPVAKGFAHLLNGIFFAPKPKDFAGAAITIAPVPTPPRIITPPLPEAPDFTAPVSAIAPDTDELEPESSQPAAHSITEETTARFVPREAQDSGFRS